MEYIFSVDYLLGIRAGVDKIIKHFSLTIGEQIICMKRNSVSTNKMK